MGSGTLDRLRHKLTKRRQSAAPSLASSASDASIAPKRSNADSDARSATAVPSQDGDESGVGGSSITSQLPETQSTYVDESGPVSPLTFHESTANLASIHEHSPLRTPIEVCRQDASRQRPRLRTVSHHHHNLGRRTRIRTRTRDRDRDRSRRPAQGRPEPAPEHTPRPAASLDEDAAERWQGRW